MKRDMQKIVLGTIAAAGIISVALIAPNALQALSSLGLIKKTGREKECVNRSLNRLIEKRLVTKNKQGFLELTNKGATELHKFSVSNYKLSVSKKWDRKWRVLIFDIPEKRRVVRNRVRLVLRQIGFVRLQDSVWVYPHECEDLIQLLKVDFGIGKNLLHLIVESIENDRHLRDHFDLASG
jgi:DNA-binding transcriptional regulator PaaX